MEGQSVVQVDRGELEVRQWDLVVSHLPLAWFHASKWTKFLNAGINFRHELYSVCVESLIASARKWRPDGKANFRTYAIGGFRYFCGRHISQSYRGGLTACPEWVMWTDTVANYDDGSINPVEELTVKDETRDFLALEKLHESLGQLLPRDREIVLLCQSCTYKEISKIYGVSIQRVQQIEHRALHLLKGMML